MRPAHDSYEDILVNRHTLVQLANLRAYKSMGVLPFLAVVFLCVLAVVYLHNVYLRVQRQNTEMLLHIDKQTWLQQQCCDPAFKARLPEVCNSLPADVEQGHGRLHIPLIVMDTVLLDCVRVMHYIVYYTFPFYLQWDFDPNFTPPSKHEWRVALFCKFWQGMLLFASTVCIFKYRKQVFARLCNIKHILHDLFCTESETITRHSNTRQRDSLRTPFYVPRRNLRQRIVSTASGIYSNIFDDIDRLHGKI